MVLSICPTIFIIKTIVCTFIISQGLLYFMETHLTSRNTEREQLRNDKQLCVSITVRLGVAVCSSTSYARQVRHTSEEDERTNGRADIRV